MKRITFIFIILLSVMASAQTRYDNNVFTTASSPNPNSYPPILALNGAVIQLCSYPSIGSSCSGIVITYTTATLVTACPANTQITRYNSTTCVGTSDAQGNFGFWYNSTTYPRIGYYVRSNNRTSGPFPIYPAASGGGSSGFPITIGSTSISPSSTTTTIAGLNLDGASITEIGFLSGVTSSIQTQLNGKQAAGSYLTGLTGDVGATGPGNAATTLASTGISPGSCGDSTHTCAITWDVKGRGLSQSNITIAAGTGSVNTSGSPTNGNLTKFSGPTTITNTDLTGDVTTSGTVATIIANGVVSLAKIANATSNSKLLGSGTSGSGAAYVELTLGTNLSMSGTTLNAAGGSSGISGLTAGFVPLAGSATTLTANSHIHENTASVTTITQPLTVTGSSSISTGTTSNTDVAGFLTLSSGTQTYTFTGTYASAPVCVATDTTATNAVKASASTTVLTITGTGTDVISYICIGRT